MAKPLKHIAVSGNIGSGKTSLTEKLARHYGWTPLYESVDQNPYLKDFYEDMTRWAFHLQIFFLNSRFNQIQQIRESEKIIIQDRTIYEDAYIFAKNLHVSGHLNDRDYQNYLAIFESMVRYVQPPDLLIYLKADIPKLVRQIELRNREYEFNIKLDYLMRLNEHYEQWMKTYEGRVLTIDMNQLDFMNQREDFATIVARIDLELNGLF